MDSVPISKFEHRVARWASRLHKERKPLRVTQRGETSLVVFPKDVYREFIDEMEKLKALEIRLLIAAGERDIALGRVYTHQQVGRMLGLTPPKKKKGRK